MSASKFPRATEVRFRDTRKAGGITVRGIQLTTDEDGYIYGPADLEPQVEPHGFIRVEKWFDALTDKEKLAVAREDDELAARLPHAMRAQLKKSA